MLSFRTVLPQYQLSSHNVQKKMQKILDTHSFADIITQQLRRKVCLRPEKRAAFLFRQQHHYFSNNQTHEVKKRTANGYGLYDMSGNVWEWCWDWYSNSTPTGGQDPKGAGSGNRRVKRGGSWGDVENFAARAYRDDHFPDFSRGSLGFRVAMSKN